MRAICLFFALLIACVPSTSPDKGRYACTTTADCGPDYDCRPQFAGGSLCFKLGECVAIELCNGTDDNCDGRTDESFPDAGAKCETGKLGVCKIGGAVCTSGAVTCGQTVMPSTETCNTLDDNCDGVVDNGFDLTSDQANCGVCGRACSEGTKCSTSVCRENRCGDGIDNDHNGFTDCADEGCFELVCQAVPEPALRCGIDAGAGPDVDGGVVRGCFGP